MANLIEKLERLESLSVKGPIGVMTKPRPSYVDHGWRSIASNGDLILAVKKEQLIPGGSTTADALKEKRLATLMLLSEARNALPKLLRYVRSLEAMLLYQHIPSEKVHAKAYSFALVELQAAEKALDND